MAKKGKLSTPDWIKEGYDSPAEYEKAKGLNKLGHHKGVPRKSSEKILLGAKKGKTFKIRECPKCGSDEVGVVLSGSDSEEASGTGQDWQCNKCKWVGQDIVKKELTEDEFMKYLDEKGEEVA